ncbi:MAG TPA: branched-chain amino acid aminotransferase [Trebonia sp.]|jgi:branched-chain amino acid aminotransferase|nr:branched-chain amino acid aminotransferase [Trebonia sp.]
MIEFDVRRSMEPVPAQQREAILAAPEFGQVFTDHMISIRWSVADGWHEPRLSPYEAIPFFPGTAVFHYSQEIFEGTKAYRQEKGPTVLFRPFANAARFNLAARRLAMPELPEEVFVRSLELLVTQDQEWVPGGNGYSLYLRPFMIATQHGLGFSRPSDSCLFCVIASPAPPYFGTGLRPITVWLSEDYTRAAPGGTGAVKAGGNYAGAFAAQAQALDRGCDQVVWLDAAEHRWVEEMGGMNLFFVYQSDAGTTISTPPLTGTLLPGITRESLLALAPRLGLTAREEPVSVGQWREQCASGELTEVFACGTAAVVAPVGRVRGRSGEWLVGNGEPGPVTRRLHAELTGIQYGTRPDPFGWVHKVC